MNISLHHNSGQFIIARLLEGGLDFEVRDGSIFGNVPIYNYVDMPRLIDDNNKQRLDVFIFRPLKPLQEGDFIQGQQVELLIPNN